MLNCFIDSKKIETIAIGNFDGMHRGHQQLLNALDAKGAIVVIEHNSACLTPGIQRTRYTSLPVYFYHLHKIKSLSANEFISLLKNDFVNLKKIVIGYDFVFGHQRSGDAKLLQQHFAVEVIEQFCIDSIAVHSRKIKELLGTDYAKAVKFLGRRYEIEGSIIKGQGVGSKELVPTFNICSNYCLPKEGVYITKTFLEGVWHQSVSFIGHRKTTDNKKAIETHLIDKDIKTASSWLKIEFLHYLRQNEKFATLQELKEQINSDIQRTKEFYEKR